jgi:hypothetical protein
MFLVSDMMGDGRCDVVDERDVGDAAEGYAGPHLTPGTARLVLGSCHPRYQGRGSLHFCTRQGDDRCEGIRRDV